MDGEGLGGPWLMPNVFAEELAGGQEDAASGA